MVEEESNMKLILGDSIEEMKKISDGSVDMVLCDLPYGVTRNKWDVGLDLGELWEQYDRVVKENGAVVLFGQDKFTATLMFSNKKNHRYNLIWEKDRPTGFLNANRMPLRSHEDIIVFYRRLPTYNPQFTEGKPNHGKGTKYLEGNTKNSGYGDFEPVATEKQVKGGSTKRYPRSVMYYPRPHPPIYPTQKPVELCEELILMYTNEGDMVLDNTMGSGTTGVACKNTGRKFIGIDSSEEAYKMSKGRIFN